MLILQKKSFSITFHAVKTVKWFPCNKTMIHASTRCTINIVSFIYIHIANQWHLQLRPVNWSLYDLGYYSFLNLWSAPSVREREWANDVSSFWMNRVWLAYLIMWLLWKLNALNNVKVMIWKSILWYVYNLHADSFLSRYTDGFVLFLNICFKV